MKQSDDDKLANTGGTRVLNDDAAADIIASEFGFARDKIEILHEVELEEINRHNMIRKTGRKAERLPLYFSTDWNYIRFNVCGWYYEMKNGHLRQFWD